METVQAQDVWYMNASYMNTSLTAQPARIRIRDKQNILDRRRPYMIAVTRFTVSGNNTLYYQPANSEATVIIKYSSSRDQAHTPVRTVTKTLSEHSYTLSDFLKLDPCEMVSHQLGPFHG